ncbi:MAG: hypothetical protein MSC31_02885 [Solirubrobacteraceae bacterium MAG38_C4-C5]|nr:hypothetical protein [Candidatus Siliceabacter maunaloa]
MSVVAPTDHGALGPVHDGDDLHLEGRGIEGREFPFGANVASLLVFDMDAAGIVNRIEILVPRTRWQAREEALSAPGGVGGGSLRVVGGRPEVYVEDVAPRFCFSGAHRQLAIEIEPLVQTTMWVALSPSCRALVNGGFLAGLVVAL